MTKLRGICCTVIRARGQGVGEVGSCMGLSVINTGHSCVHHSFGREASFCILSALMYEGQRLKGGGMKTRNSAGTGSGMHILYGLVNEFMNLGL